jgi:hypothetical protein
VKSRTFDIEYDRVLCSEGCPQLRSNPKRCMLFNAPLTVLVEKPKPNVVRDRRCVWATQEDDQAK